MLTDFWLLPADEKDRLDTLHRYADASCLHEPVFEGLIDLSARLFNLAVAFISLVEADEVVYKANQGLPQLARQPRPASVCALTIRYNKTLLFTDLAQPAQYTQLTTSAALAIQANGIRFYISIPLRMPDQRPIGTFCLVGYQARPFGADEQRVLEQLAGLVEQLLVIRHTCFASSWLGEEHWSRIQTTFAEGLWELSALTRYLLKRTGTHIPVPADVLGPVARRLAELHRNLAVHPGSLL